MRAWRTPAALALAMTLGAPTAIAAHAADTPPALVSDATGPLFTAVALVPGAPLERCLRLTWSGGTGATLGVSARVVGDLAPYLDATVQAGTGGGFDGCGGFVPQGAGWSGSLAGLTADHGEPARQAPLVAADHAGSTTVRITVAVQEDNRAQALRATGDLVFALVTGTTVPDPTPTPTPEPSPTPEPTPGPAPAPTVDPAPAPTSTPEPPPADPPPAAPPADGAATPRPAPASPAPSDAPDATEDGPAEQDPAGGPSARPTPPDVQATVTIPLAPGGPADAPEPSWLQDAVSRWLGAAGEGAGAVSRAVGWTFWTAPLVILFLLVQNRIDARDPKLAEAPAEAVPGLLFDETYDVPPGDGPVASGGAP